MTPEEDPIKLHRETVEISGGRRLYLYTFEVTDEGPEAREGDRYPESPDAGSMPNAAAQGTEPND